MPKKRTDGRYEVKVRISKPGEPRKYKSVYGDTLKEAKAQAEIVRQAVDSNKWSDATVNDIIEYWLAQKAKIVRPQTLRTYRTALHNVIEAVGSIKASDLTVDDVRQLHDEISFRSPVQANNMAARMKAVYHDAVIRGVVSSNPWTYVAPTRHEKMQKRALTADELQQIDRAELLPWERAFVSVLRYTGIRKGEALALDAEDIDFATEFINIDKNNVNGRIGPPKTKASKRRVPMPKPLVSVLKTYMEQYHCGEGILFPNQRGEHIHDCTFWRLWWNIARKIFGEDPPEDFTPHIFRHTYSSELVRNKVPPTTAMLILGHKSLATTMNVYTHLGWQDIDTEQINNIFRDN